MAIRKNQFRQDSEQLPTKLSPEEEMLIKLGQQNTQFERNELIVPRLKILQPLNPEVQEDSAQHINGAKPGMFFNTSSSKLTSGQEGMIIVVIGHQRQVIEWVPRDAGGGLVKIWGMDEGWKAKCSPEQRDNFNPVTTDGHTIDKQRSFLIFDIDPNTGETDPSFFNMRSTGNRVANFLSTMLTQTKMKLSNGQIATPPYYYFTYKLTLEKLTNVKGTWWSPKFVKNVNQKGEHIRLKDMPNGERIFEQAVLFQKHFLEGEITSPDWENQETEQGTF